MEKQWNNGEIFPFPNISRHPDLYYTAELPSIEKTTLSFHVFVLMCWNFSFQPNSEDLEKKVEELRKEYQEARLRARGVLSGNNTPNSGASPVNNVSPK